MELQQPAQRAGERGSEGPWPSFQARAARRLVRKGLQKKAKGLVLDLREGRGKEEKGERERIEGRGAWKGQTKQERQK
jgi:hypothetical protein